MKSKFILFLFLINISCSQSIEDFLYPPDKLVYYDFGDDTTKYVVISPVILLTNPPFESLKQGSNWKYYYMSVTGNPDNSTSFSEFVFISLYDTSGSQYHFSVVKSSGNTSFSIDKSDSSIENEYSQYVSTFWSKNIKYPIVKLDSNGAYQHVFLTDSFSVQTRELIINNKYGTLYKLFNNNDPYMHSMNYIKLIEHNGIKVEYSKILKEITAKDNYLLKNPSDTIYQ